MSHLIGSEAQSAPNQPIRGTAAALALLRRPAALFGIIVIGVVVEYVIFRTLELRTVRRWGMQR